MNKVFTLLTSLLLIFSTQAAPPTTPASNLFFSNVDGARFTISFNRGNGAYRIVVMREAAAVAGMPVNGMDYTANSEFGTPSSAFTTPDEFVVYKGTGNVVTVTKLKPSTNYHVSVFEFNGTGASTEYLTTALTGQLPTLSHPTTQASGMQFQNTTGNATTVRWTNGNGTSRIVIARKNGNAQTDPEDLALYTPSAKFGSGSALAAGNYVIYHSNGSSVALTNLEPNTIYRLAVYETNGTRDPLYLKPGAVGTVQTTAGPTEASRNINFHYVEGNRMRINFTGGNGSRRLVIAKKGSAVTAVPTNGNIYIANGAFGSGTEIAPGEFVVSNSDATSINLTNLEKNTVYHFRIYEYDVDQSNYSYYLTSSYASASMSTASTPTISPSDLLFYNSTGSSTTVMFTPGNGAYRIVVIKEGSAVNAVPVDLTAYDGHYHYGHGSQIAPGNYVLHRGTNGNSANIANLSPGKTYHVAVFEYNGYYAPVYNPEPARGVLVIPNEPSNPSSGFEALNIDGTSFRPSWTNGNGARRIVIAKKGAAVLSKPVDGTTYIANQAFGTGTQLQPGEFVVYDGIAEQFDLTNLEAASTYHFAIFDYNLTSTGPDYLTTTWLAGSASTIDYPTAQTSGLHTVSVSGNSATVTFAAGNGKGRIFVIRESEPVNAYPQDGRVYMPSIMFGNSVLQGDNYIIHQSGSTTGEFTVTNLAPNKTYHIAAFEFNGATGPAYLRPGATLNFTTSAVLPARWKYFTAKRENDRVLLEWATYQETGTKSFIVERSFDGITFESIDSVQAAGNSTIERKYHSIDRTFSDGKRFYRLKQTDRNGNYHYSVIVSAETAGSKIRLYPNPATGFIIIDLDKDDPKAMVHLYNSLGAAVKRVSAGKEGKVDISALPAGTYYVEVVSGQQFFRTSFIKH